MFVINVQMIPSWSDERALPDTYKKETSKTTNHWFNIDAKMKNQPSSTSLNTLVQPSKHG